LKVAHHLNGRYRDGAAPDHVERAAQRNGVAAAFRQEEH
jgi:hypothetical protein